MKIQKMKKNEGKLEWTPAGPIKPSSQKLIANTMGSIGTVLNFFPLLFMFLLSPLIILALDDGVSWYCHSALSKCKLYLRNIPGILFVFNSGSQCYCFLFFIVFMYWDNMKYHRSYWWNLFKRNPAFENIYIYPKKYLIVHFP